MLHGRNIRSNTKAIFLINGCSCGGKVFVYGAIQVAGSNLSGIKEFSM